MPAVEIDKSNPPTLALPFGLQQTEGRPIWYEKLGNQTAYIALLGKSGMDGMNRVRYGGQDLAEFDTSGNRQWKFHDGTAATEFPDAFFSHLNWNGTGRSFIEVKLPAAFSDEGEPTRSQFWVRGLRVKDYDATGAALSAGATAFRRGNAHVFADVWLIRAANYWAQRGLDPKTLVEWASWVEFKQECDYQLTWATGNGLKGEYFDNVDLTNLKVTRTDSVVDFDWSYSFPANEIAADTFSVRWTGTVKPEFTEDYTFYLRGDDGFRLWVNGALVVNSWIDGTERELTGTIALTANTDYNIVLEYYQQTGVGKVSLSWSSPSRAKQLVPQSRLTAGARQVARYTADVVFTSRTPLEDAVKAIMLRAPGVSMQLVGGVWRFLPTPVRPSVHRFSFDTTQAVVKPNIVEGYQAFRRKPSEKPREIIVNYRNEEELYFEARQIKIVRAAYTGEPLVINIGVANQSLAERIGESIMRRFDLDLFYRTKAFPSSYKVAKGDGVEASNSTYGWLESAPLRFRILEEKFLPTGDLREFFMQLHSDNYYSDTAHGQLQYSVASNIKSPFTPPPVVTSVALVEGGRQLQDRTYISTIQGTAQFAEHGYPEQGRLWWRNPGDERAVNVNSGGDLITLNAHAYANGTPVAFRNSGGALPAPLSAAATYYVRDATTNTFKLAATPAGAALDLTSDGTGTQYVAAFKPTERILVPDPTTKQAPFELAPVVTGMHQVKVISESQAGVRLPFEQHATYSLMVAGIVAAPAAVTGFKAVATKGGRGHIFTLSWNSSGPDTTYRVYTDAALTQLVSEGPETTVTVKVYSYAPTDFWIVALNRFLNPSPAATTKAITVFADTSGGGVLAFTNAGAFSWSSALVISPVPVEVAPSGSLSIAAGSYALGLNQILVARHTLGLATPTLSIFNLSSYTLPAAGSGQMDFEIARREADGTLTLFDGRRMRPGTKLNPTDVINQFSRYVGRDTDKVDITQRTFYSWAQVKYDREGDWIDLKVYCNFDSILSNDDSTANVDSCQWARPEALDKFGNRVEFLTYPYQGYGVCGLLGFPRINCDPDTELTIAIKFWNVFGWTAEALYLRPGNVMSFSPPAFKVPSNCPRNLLATPRSASEVALSWEWTGTARSVWLREVAGTGQGQPGAWVDVTAAATGDKVTTATLTGLSPFTRYEFRVNDGTGGAGGNNSNIAYVRTFAPAVAAASRPAPSNVVGTPQSATSVLFIWARNASDNTDVEYSLNGGAWTSLASASLQEKSFTVAAGSTTTFKVRNKWATGTLSSDESNTASATTPAQNPSNTDPTDLALTSTGFTTASFAWAINSGTNPTLHVKNLDDGSVVHINPTATTTTHTRAGLLPDIEYEAWVTTSNGNRDSNHIFFFTKRNVDDDPYR
jgi:hypothetical protein